MNNQSGTLYIVSTPIGNLGDITLRAIETLKSADVIACEDTRHTGMLLKHLQIKKPLVSLYQAKEAQKSQQVLGQLKEGKDIALVSDAGTPTIQDPGYRLIKMCHDANIEVVSIPGASAVISALSISGLPTDSFVFEGFLPIKSGARKKVIETWKLYQKTIIFYASPHKILKELLDAKEVLGDIEVTIARELTKKFEEVITDKVSNFIEKYEQSKPKGEIVVLLSFKE